MTNDNNAASSPENAGQATEIKGPGAILRKARERYKLSIEEVAQDLRLTTTIIMAIESDNYSKISGHTFIRGYLRSYARLLNLSSQEIINAFENLGLIDKPVHNTAQTIYAKSSSMSERFVSWITGLVVIGLIIMVFMWWQAKQTEAYVPVKPPATVPARPSIDSQTLPPPIPNNRALVAIKTPPPTPKIATNIIANPTGVAGAPTTNAVGGAPLPANVPQVVKPGVAAPSSPVQASPVQTQAGTTAPMQAQAPAVISNQANPSANTPVTVPATQPTAGTEEAADDSVTTSAPSANTANSSDVTTGDTAADNTSLNSADTPVAKPRVKKPISRARSRNNRVEIAPPFS